MLQSVIIKSIQWNGLRASIEPQCMPTKYRTLIGAILEPITPLEVIGAMPEPITPLEVIGTMPEPITPPEIPQQAYNYFSVEDIGQLEMELLVNRDDQQRFIPLCYKAGTN